MGPQKWSGLVLHVTEIQRGEPLARGYQEGTLTPGLLPACLCLLPAALEFEARVVFEAEGL